ncbi:PEP-CTERM sorting domain-containing protein [Phragmitibacter flavus]|uniref:PEP-CTERM sorting domain-containing protein n=1 Tax=Phragmitibacter flavus TaxID=2576071 RepID=A0A5R8KAN7_9BACT|nr:PEP-CTERM sorting domain-containing protein [Phragmitibacter flavus]TLD69372.1 PEP-CTERM sorting domain-containing protein [Phragmitibacter flavus]
MKRKFYPVALAFLMAQLSPTTLQAVVLASEDFVFGAAAPAYTTNTSPANRSGTDNPGFTGAWTNNGTGYFNTSTTNLSLPGYASPGGSMLVTPNSNGEYSRSISRTFTADTTASTTIWTSTLFRPSTLAFDAGRESMIHFLSGGSGSDSPTSVLSSMNQPTVGASYGALWGGQNGTSSGHQLQGFGYGISTFADTSTTMSLKYQTGANTVALVDTNINLSLNTTYFVLSKLNLNVSGTYDTLDFWVLTSLPTSEALLGAPSYSITAADQVNLLTASSNLNNVVFAAGTLLDAPSSSSLTNFDAIRIGTTFADVTAIPEPSRALLLGTALGLTLLHRRRPMTNITLQ